MRLAHHNSTLYRSDRTYYAETYLAKACSSTFGKTYLDLLDDTEFLAGALDARGTAIPYASKKNQKNYSILALSSKNRALVTALKDKFGGRIVDLYGNAADDAKTSSLVWRVTDSNRIGNVLEAAKGSLRFKDKIRAPL